jgi:hypothetical protein
VSYTPLKSEQAWLSRPGNVHIGRSICIVAVACHSSAVRGDRQAVLDAFAPMRVSGEGMSSTVNLVALDIGPDATHVTVKPAPARGEAAGRWYFEEGCVTEEWPNLPWTADYVRICLDRRVTVAAVDVSARKARVASVDSWRCDQPLHSPLDGTSIMWNKPTANK